MIMTDALTFTLDTSPPLPPVQFDLESMFAKTKLAEFINAAGPGTVPGAAGAAGGGGGGAPLLQGATGA
jgi:hypothetical protein